MLLVKSPDGVDAISLHHPFLIQCPKTNGVHTIQKRAHYNKAYYVTVQRPYGGGFQYITDDNISEGSTDKRYYFTEEKLKELVRSQRFTISGCI